MTPFLPRHVSEVAREIAESPDWLVQGRIPKGILALLSAYPKVGKSQLASQLAVAVAQGRPFLGQPTSQGAVLYVVAEERKDDVVRRLRDLGMNDDTDPIYLWTDTASDDPTEHPKIEDFIREHKIVLVIIDTFASYLLLKDETNNSNVTLRFKPYAGMSHNTEATILFVHHERKNREEGDGGSRAIRGGGAILGLADLSLQLQQLSGGGTRRDLRIVGRYAEIPKRLQLDYVNGEYVCISTSEDGAVTANRETVLAVLPTAGTGPTVTEAAKAAGLGKSATRRTLEEAVTSGKVSRSGEGKKNDPHRYLRATTPAAKADEESETVAVGLLAEEVAEL